jgi:hypothetical protein
MPDFDHDSLRAEETHGGFSASDDNTFGTFGSDDVSDVSDSFVTPEPAPQETASKPLAEPLAEPLPEPLTEPLAAFASFGGESNREPTIEQTTEPIPKAVPTPVPAPLPTPNSSPAERLRFGFDETPPSNQRVPPPLKKSWFAEKSTTLAVAAGMALMTGAVAAYFLTTQKEVGQRGVNSVDSVAGIALDTNANLKANESVNLPVNVGNESPVTTVDTALARNAPVVATTPLTTTALPPDRSDAVSQGGQSQDVENTSAQASSTGSKQPVTSDDIFAGSTTSAKKDLRMESKPLKNKSTKAKPSKSDTSKSDKSANKIGMNKAIPNQTMASKTNASQEKTPTTKQLRSKPNLVVYAIQVYSTASPLEAERVKRQLEMRGLRAVRVVPVDLGNRFMYRVRFGSYASEADAVRSASRSGYADTWVVQTR